MRFDAKGRKSNTIIIFKDALMTGGCLKLETKTEIPLYLHMMGLGCLLNLCGSEEIDEELIFQVGVDEDSANFIVKELLIDSEAGYFGIDVRSQIHKTVFASKNGEILLEISLIGVKLFECISWAVRMLLDDFTN